MLRKTGCLLRSENQPLAALMDASAPLTARVSRVCVGEIRPVAVEVEMEEKA